MGIEYRNYAERFTTLSRMLTGAIELNYALQGRNGTIKFRLEEDEDISRATTKRFDLCWLDDKTAGATQRFICAIADYVFFYFK